MQEHERELAEADARQARRERTRARVGWWLVAAGMVALFAEFVLPVDRRVTLGAAGVLWAVAAVLLVASDWRRRVGGGSRSSQTHDGFLDLVSAFFR
ncbi:hypothetical protein [Blastococcus sp. SYSU D00695]